MITEEEYLKAQSIVDAYKEQTRKDSIKLSAERAKIQKTREESCGEHYYLPRGKWLSGSECQDCGKIID